MVSEQFDRCHGTLLQYVDFLGSAVTPGSNYALLIPSLDDLVHLYHLDPEVCISLLSPFLINFITACHHLYAILYLNLHLILFFLSGQVAFLIYRPVMRLFKSQRTPDVCWPLDDKNAASDSSTNFESDPADSSGSMVLDFGSNKKKQIRL
jgi:THO complex subunit 2